jgi:hypothetical protein
LTANGAMVALNLADLAKCIKGASGTDCLRAPLNRDVHGYPVPAETLTWANTLPNGTDAGGPNCNSWTAYSAGVTGNGGSVDQLGAGWSSGSVRPCNQLRRLICLQL